LDKFGVTKAQLAAGQNGRLRAKAVEKHLKKK
jgi:hypothetical protein